MTAAAARGAITIRIIRQDRIDGDALITVRNACEAIERATRRGSRLIREDVYQRVLRTLDRIDPLAPGGGR